MGPRSAPMYTRTTRWGSAQLPRALHRDTVDVPEVREVEQLQVDPAHAGALGPLSDPVDDLVRGARDAPGPQVVRLAADGGGPACDLRVVRADAYRLGRGQGDLRRVAADRLAGGD